MGKNLYGPRVKDASIPQSALEVKTNFEATTNPATTDNQSLGYLVGSRWINTSTQVEWVCIASNNSTANWKQVYYGDNNVAYVKLSGDNMTGTLGTPKVNLTYGNNIASIDQVLQNNFLHTNVTDIYSLTGVSKIDANVWVVGNNSSGASLFAKSLNSGSSFGAASSIHANFYDATDVTFLTSTLGFVVGSAYNTALTYKYPSLIKSINGTSFDATTLTQVIVAADNSDGLFYKLKFFNSSLGFAVGYSKNYLAATPPYGLIIKTTDGGTTWNNASPQILTDYSEIWDIGFLSSTTMFIVGAGSDSLPRMSKSTNGGDTWTHVPLTTVLTSFLTLRFYDSNIGVLGGGGDSVYVTTDGGVNWTRRVITGVTEIRDIKTFSTTEFFGVGTTSDTKGGFIYSIDSGTTWELHKTTNNGFYEKLTIISADSTIAVGRDTVSNNGVSTRQSISPALRLFGSNNINKRVLVNNIETPSSSFQAVNKAYADLKLPLAGGTMTGAISMRPDIKIVSSTDAGNYIILQDDNEEMLNGILIRSLSAISIISPSVDINGTTTNFYGTTTNFYGTTSQFAAKTFRMNFNAGVGTGSGIGLDILENALITGYFKTNALRTGWELKAPGVAGIATILNATGSFSYTLPEKSGTIALISDITGTTSPLTTKGDIWTYTTTNARLGVGLNNEVLVADSLTASGLAYKTISTILGYTPLSGNQTITLSGEASGSGATAITVTLDNASVIGKVLTGLSTATGGTIAATDTILAAFGKLQHQITNATGTATPAGTNTQIQYNNSGAFGAAATFTFDSVTKRIGLGSLATSTYITTYASLATDDGLCISGTNLGATFSVQNRNASGYSGIEYLNNAGAVKVFTGFNNGNGLEFRFNNIATNGYINFMTNNNIRLHLANDGKVGIGISSALASQLHIKSLSSANPVLLLDGATSQSGDFVQLRDSANVVLFSLTAAGNIKLTSQKGIQDINGNYLLRSVATVTNAINYFTINNGATGNNPILSVVDSTDPHVGMTYLTKGSGIHTFINNAVSESTLNKHPGFLIKQLLSTKENLIQGAAFAGDRMFNGDVTATTGGFFTTSGTLIASIPITSGGATLAADGTYSPYSSYLFGSDTTSQILTQGSTFRIKIDLTVNSGGVRFEIFEGSNIVGIFYGIGTYEFDFVASSNNVGINSYFNGATGAYAVIDNISIKEVLDQVDLELIGSDMNSTLNAGNNYDHLIGLRIKPNFNDGIYSNVYRTTIQVPEEFIIRDTTSFSAQLNKKMLEIKSKNTFLGRAAGQITKSTNDSNTGIGYFALSNNGHGIGNVAIGSEALKNTNGNYNIGIGAFTKTQSNYSSNQLIIGSTQAKITVGYIGGGYQANANENGSLYNFTLYGTSGNGLDRNGSNLTIAPGASTGNAAGGSFIVRTAKPGSSSGSTLNTYTNAFVIDSKGIVKIRTGTYSNANESGNTKLGGILLSTFTEVGNNTTTETSLTEFSLQGDMFGTDGDNLIYKASGIFTNNANNKVINVVVNSTILLTETFAGGGADNWEVELVIIRTSGTTINYKASIITSISATPVKIRVGTLTGLNLTSFNTIKISGTGTATNDIIMKGSTCHWYPHNNLTLI